jgi:hypothetical protein
MTDLAQALVDFVALFERLQTPYVVMGGLAVRVYGIPRPTYEVDFTLAIPRERLSEMYQEIQKLGYSVAEEYLTGWVDEVAGMPLIKVRLYVAGRTIDIDIFLAESAYQEELLSRRQRHQIDHFQAWFVSPEDLVLLKLLAKRPRDLADIGDVLFTQGQMDEQYLRHWADVLGVRDDLEKVLAQPPS